VVFEVEAQFFRALAAACLVLAAAAVMTAQEPAPRTLDRGQQSNIDAPKQAVARTQVEWTGLWKAHNFDRPAPAVDFSKEMVVAVFLGSRPTAGFEVTIIGAAPRDGALVVSYRETAPPPGSITAQVLTMPYHIAAMPKRSGEVKFEKVP
jgi:protease stability complex PrcB-like protein